MKRIVILSVILVCSISTYSQEKDSIIFIFPDRVEVLLYERINEFLSLDENYKFRFHLERMDRDKFRIRFIAMRGMPMRNYWARNTNRFILINNKKYPLTFDYDSKFSTSSPETVQYYRGERMVRRTLFMHEGYSITFDEWGKYVSEDWGIFRPKSNKPIKNRRERKIDSNYVSF